MLRPTKADIEVRWLPCRNDAGEDVLPFSLLRVAAVDADGVLVVDAPDQDSQSDLLVCGPLGIAKDGFGLCTHDSPMRVLYDPAGGTPNSLQDWGSKAGSFKLALFKTGYQILGAPADGSVLALASPAPAAGGGTVPDVTRTVRGVVNVNHATPQFMGQGEKVFEGVGFSGTSGSNEVFFQYESAGSLGAGWLTTRDVAVHSPPLALHSVGSLAAGGCAVPPNVGQGVPPGSLADDVYLTPWLNAAFLSIHGPYWPYANPGSSVPKPALTLQNFTGFDPTVLVPGTLYLNSNVFVRSATGTFTASGRLLGEAGTANFEIGATDFNNVLHATKGLVTQITHQDFLYAF